MNCCESKVYLHGNTAAAAPSVGLPHPSSGLWGWLQSSCTQPPWGELRASHFGISKRNEHTHTEFQLSSEMFEMLINPSAELGHDEELPHFLHWQQWEPGDKVRGRCAKERQSLLALWQGSLGHTKPCLGLCRLCANAHLLALMDGSPRGMCFSTGCQRITEC